MAQMSFTVIIAVDIPLKILGHCLNNGPLISGRGRKKTFIVSQTMLAEMTTVADVISCTVLNPMTENVVDV